MTFSVLLIENERPTVVGTLWAQDEAGARAIAPALCPSREGATVSVRRAEERELPLRISEMASGSPFC